MINPPSLNERRIVTVMSVDVVGSTRLVAGLDPDDAQDLLDTVFARIQAAVESGAGTIVAFTGDGALVVFGWPEAGEQHADNACRAALEIQAVKMAPAPEALPVQLRIGISSGLVVVRRIEVGLVSRYDVVGDAAHRAAGLQKRAAAGGILVCDSTRKLAPAQAFKESAQLDLGLRTGPVQAFTLRHAQGEEATDLFVQRHRYPVHGRDGEIARLRRLVESETLTPVTIACIGEPGLGKSRLAAAVSTFGMESGRRVIVHECRDLDSASPFAGARALMLAVLGGEPSGISDIAAAFARSGGAPEDLAAMMAIFNGPDRPAKGKGAELASQTRVARTLARTLAQGALQHATLLIVEDLHNLDPESRQVLAFISNESPPHALALFATGRPEARETAETIASDVISLAPLDDEAVTRLVALATANSGLTQAATAEIVSRTAGNPFVMTQLLEYADPTGPARGQTVLPRSVESLIHARLDRLSPDARQLAQTLSLLGSSVEADLAVAVAGDHAHAASRAMLELEQLAFIHPPASGEILFRHALIGAACASSVVRGRRQAVHGAALDALSLRQDELPNLYPRLALHAEEAGRDDRAIDLHWEAARRARSLGASQSLMVTFERALACCERLGAAGEMRFVDLVLLVFETFHLQGEIDRIEPHLLRAVDYARKQGRRDKLCVAQCHLGIAAWYRGRFAEGERIMRPAFEQAQALGHLPLRFAAQFILAQQLHNLARIDEALALIEELCDILTGDLEFARLGAMGLPSAVANAHAGYYCLEAGRFEDATRHLGKAMEIAETGADPYSESLARIALGRCYLLMQRNLEAVDCLERGAAIIERQGYDPALLNITGLLATALSRVGRAAEAVQLSEARLKQGLFGRTGSYERHYFWCGYGEALVAARRAEEGLARIDEAIAIARATSNPCILVQSLSLKAAALGHIGRKAPEMDAALSEARDLERRHGLVAPRVAFSPA